MYDLLVITGPTATGKTALGIALARLTDGEVVSADSMQIYRGMDIGTAKPTPAETAGGIIKRETPIRACKVALYCPKCDKGVRIGFKVEGEKKTRVCRKCGAEI